MAGGLLVAELDLDRERTRGWAVAHALAWGVSDTTWFPDQVEASRLITPC